MTPFQLYIFDFQCAHNFNIERTISIFNTFILLKSFSIFMISFYAINT